MSKIAVIIGDMFEDVEYTEPAKAFKAKGHSLVHVGLEEFSGGHVLRMIGPQPRRLRPSLRNRNVHFQLR